MSPEAWFHPLLLKSPLPLASRNAGFGLAYFVLANRFMMFIPPPLAACVVTISITGGPNPIVAYRIQHLRIRLSQLELWKRLFAVFPHGKPFQLYPFYRGRSGFLVTSRFPLSQVVWWIKAELTALAGKITSSWGTVPRILRRQAGFLTFYDIEKGVTNGFPLRIEAEKVVEKAVEMNL